MKIILQDKVKYYLLDNSIVIGLVDGNMSEGKCIFIFIIYIVQLVFLVIALFRNYSSISNSHCERSSWLSHLVYATATLPTRSQGELSITCSMLQFNIYMYACFQPQSLECYFRNKPYDKELFLCPDLIRSPWPQEASIHTGLKL